MGQAGEGLVLRNTKRVFEFGKIIMESSSYNYSLLRKLLLLCILHYLSFKIVNLIYLENGFRFHQFVLC